MEEENEKFLDSTLRLSEEESDITYIQDETIPSWHSSLGTKLNWLLLLLLMASNAGWALAFFWTYKHQVDPSTQTCELFFITTLSSYIAECDSVPPYNQVTIPFEHKTTFGKGDSENKTNSDELWASLVPGELGASVRRRII
jgi:hypothetical protein